MSNWIPNKPEQRLSIALDRFLDRAMKRPCYYTAIHDADGGARTDIQRTRDKNRGIKSGQLDWEVHQGIPYITRKIELKRGKNSTSHLQDQTIENLTECGARPIVAWTLRSVFIQMEAAGFRFHDNVETTLQHCEALLESWDREAEVRKAAAPKALKSRKTAPRHVAGKRLSRAFGGVL